MREVLRYASGVWPHVGGTVALQVAVAATLLAQGFLLADILAALIDGEGLGAQRTSLLVVVALVAVRSGLLWCVEAVRARTAVATKAAVRDRAFAKVAELGPGHLSGDRTGEVAATVVDGVEALEGYYARYLPSLIAGLLAPLGAVVALALHDVWLGGLVLAFVLAAILLPQLWIGALADRSEARMTASVGLAATVLDTLQGLVTLKAFGASRRRRAELEELGDRLARTWVKEMATALVSLGIFAACVTGGIAAAAWVAGSRVADGGLAVGTAFLALILSAEALRPVSVLADSFHTSHDSRGAARRLDALFALPAPAPDQGVLGATGLEPAVAFEGITFTYPGAVEPALRDLTLRVDAGETVAVVGASGAGKSTLVALLARFFDPQLGAVTIGGRDVRDLALAALRSSIAVVSQDTHLFTGTVRENLLMARPGATAAQVEAAARAAGAHDFVLALPDGYDSEVGESGGRLSGGQRQRVAITRALLADAPILVLDEATASVDAATEAGIQAALDRLDVGRTTLVIAHRLSTVRHADRIVVLHDGRVVETGRHDDMIAGDGHYRRLVTAQEAPA